MTFAAILRAGALALAAITTMAVAAPAHAEWRRAETAHFIIYGDGSDRSLRSYAQKVERFDAFLRTYYPIQVDNEIPKLEIYLAEGARDMNRAYPGIPSSVAGYYSSNDGRIYAVVNNQSIGGDVVLFHEYAHHFMFQMRSNAYPSWFVEGFAEYYATAEVRPDRIQFGRHHPGRMNSLTLGANAWAPMEDLLEWRYTPSGRYPGHLYYAQAWAMTHYFMSKPERTQMLGRYLSSVVSGVNSVEAMRAATGRTTEELQRDIRMYLSGSIEVLTPQIEIPEPEVTITTLTPAEQAMIWLDVRLDTEEVIETPPEEDGRTQKSEEQKAREARERAEHRAELIRDAFAAGERFSDDRMGMLVTARAHRLERDPAAALAALEPLLGPTSTDADALRIAAMALLDQAKDADAATALPLRRRASGYLARSMDAEPLDFRTYLGLNTVRQGLSGYPNENDVSTLEVAATLAPQSFDARLRLGHAYMARQSWAEAIVILRPVANSPHRSSYTRRAREMIATCQTALGQTVDTAEPPPPEEADVPNGAPAEGD
jgi:hypothetical protein